VRSTNSRRPSGPVRTGTGWKDRSIGHSTAWLAWLLWVVSVVLAGLSIPFGARNAQSPESLVGDLLPPVTLTIAFASVGVLVATRRPEHPLGWLFCVVGVCQGLITFTDVYAVYALWTAPGSVPAGPFMAWLTTWVWAGGFPVLLTYLPLLFPDGRLPSARWRPVAWLSAVPPALLCGPIAILYWPLRGPDLVRPGDWSQPTPGALAVLTSIVGLLMLVCGFACALSLVLRFRRARGVERQQLKWFMFAAAVTFTVWFGVDQLGATGVQLGLAGALVLVLISVSIPAAAGVAIVRYRLYDIDRVINRTLVYVMLTALLSGVYAGAVLVLGQLFGGLGDTSPSWAVAGATLAVAAMFQPARRRIQQSVDRRFNRRHHDAAKTVEAFGARLRDQIDLDTLSAELVAVAGQTMEPTAVSLWLRPPTEGARAFARLAPTRPTPPVPPP
jgi:hypothetical protein